MKDNRDKDVLKHIVKYCEEIEHTTRVMGNNFADFDHNSIYQNAIALCILQIGELTTHFTEEFKQSYKKIKWNQIKALRNIVAHDYGKIDTEILWETLQGDIPVLKEYCEQILDLWGKNDKKI